MAHALEFGAVAGKPHLAFPLRFRGTAFETVDQDDPAHVQQCAEVILRTRPGTFEATPEVGLRDLVGTLSPVGPAVLDALERFEPRRRFMAEEDEAALAARVRRVMVDIAREDA